MCDNPFVMHNAVYVNMLHYMHLALRYIQVVGLGGGLGGRWVDGRGRGRGGRWGKG